MSSFENNAEGGDHDNRVFAVSVSGLVRCTSTDRSQVARTGDLCVHADPQDADSWAHAGADGLISCVC